MLEDTTQCLYKQYAEKEKEKGNIDYIMMMNSHPYNCFECTGEPYSCPNYASLDKVVYRGID